MREIRTYGSVRGAARKGRPYRDPQTRPSDPGSATRSPTRPHAAASSRLLAAWLSRPETPLRRNSVSGDWWRNGVSRTRVPKRSLGTRNFRALTQAARPGRIDTPSSRFFDAAIPSWGATL